MFAPAPQGNSSDKIRHAPTNHQAYPFYSPSQPDSSLPTNQPTSATPGACPCPAGQPTPAAPKSRAYKIASPHRRHPQKAVPKNNAPKAALTKSHPHTTAPTKPHPVPLRRRGAHSSRHSFPSLKSTKKSRRNHAGSPAQKKSALAPKPTLRSNRPCTKKEPPKPRRQPCAKVKISAHKKIAPAQKNANEKIRPD